MLDEHIIILFLAESQTLAKPEFEGMWNKFERYVVPKEVVVDVIKGSKVSKMDQDIMREKLQRQKENIVQTQIAAGREFKGKSSFNSKPTVVHFKVNWIYFWFYSLTFIFVLLKITNFF